jgi:type II secretory pathway predicted ATPase ExeA
MKDEKDFDENFREAALAIFNSLDPAGQERVARLGKMNSSYFRTPRDNALDHAFTSLIENSAAEMFGKAGKRRALFVVGESGSGKTTAVEKHISKRPQFQPRLTPDGEQIRPMVSFEAPKPLTLKGLARAGLAALDFDVPSGSMTAEDLFDLWKHQLRQKRVLYLAIDEMQHVLRGNTAKEIQNVADVVKSLLQIAGWPLHIVLSGVPALARFLHQEGESERQLKERSVLVEFRRMSFPNDCERMRKILERIVTTDAQLECEGIKDDEFIHKIIHACNGAFGSMIQLMRKACETAMRFDKTKVDVTDFEIAYSLASGCRPSQNIFTAPDWHTILPDNSLADMIRGDITSAAEVNDKPTRKRKDKSK